MGVPCSATCMRPSAACAFLLRDTTKKLRPRFILLRPRFILFYFVKYLSKMSQKTHTTRSAARHVPFFPNAKAYGKNIRSRCFVLFYFVLWETLRIHQRAQLCLLFSVWSSCSARVICRGWLFVYSAHAARVCIPLPQCPDHCR